MTPHTVLKSKCRKEREQVLIRKVSVQERETNYVLIREEVIPLFQFHAINLLKKNMNITLVLKRK